MTIAQARGRAARPLAAGAFVTLALAACSGTPSATPTSVATSTASGSGAATTTPPTATTPTATPVKARVSKPLANKRTIAALGKDGVASAWKLSSDLGSTYAFDPALMTRPAQDLEVRDFEKLRGAMTPTAQKEWDRYVRGLPAIRSFKAVNTLATVGVNINGSRLRSTEPVSGFTITGAVLAFDDGGVVTAQTQIAVLHLIDSNNDPVKATVERLVTLHLVKKSGRWKISSWESETEPRLVEPDR